MPKLECGSNRAWQDSEKFLKQHGVSLHIRRQLKQQRSQLACALQRFHRAQKTRDEVFRFLQSLYVRDHLVSFNAETKSGRGGVDPLLRSRFLQQLAKGKVHLDCVELRRIVLQKSCLGQLGGIKVRLPAWIGPSRCARIKLRHISTLPKARIISKALRIIPFVTSFLAQRGRVPAWPSWLSF